MGRCLNLYKQYSRRNCLLIHGVKKNEKEDSDEVVIEIFINEMEEKVSVNDIDPINLEKDTPEVDLSLLSLNLQGTMSIMQFLEKRRYLKERLLVQQRT